MGFLQRFMQGRNGVDPLTAALVLAYFVLQLAWAFTRLRALSWIAWLVAFFAIYRVLSHNVSRRRRENQAFLRMVGPFGRWLRLRRTILCDKEHRYFKCPNCGRYLRVPRGKGRITVTCRNCSVSFEEKS